MKPSQPRVLIADDDEHLVDVLRRRCTHLGLHVETASSGLAVLNALETNEPDLMILDINMPHGNGLDLCQMLATDEHTRHVPVIILTGRKDEHTIRRCHNLMAYYVLKCTDVWSRIEPLLAELLGVAVAAPAPVCRQPSGGTCSTRSDAAQGAMPIEPTSPNELPPVADSVSAATRSVLCIDDDCHFAYSLKLRLEGHGVAVRQASSALEGYRAAFLNRPVAILLDYEMADGNGDYALGRLKENPLTRQVPVIVLTGQRGKALERRMASLGAARFLNKPVKWAELWAELQRHLDAADREWPTVEDERAPAIGVGVGSSRND